MASSAGTNAVLDSAGTGFGPQIVKQEMGTTYTQSYVLGGTRYRGVARWITTNTGDNDATQAAAILTALD